MIEITALNSASVKIVFSQTVYDVDYSNSACRRVEIAEYFDEKSGGELIATLQAKLKEAKALKFVKNAEALKKKRGEAAAIAREIEALEHEQAQLSGA